MTPRPPHLPHRGPKGAGPCASSPSSSSAGASGPSWTPRGSCHRTPAGGRSAGCTGRGLRKTRTSASRTRPGTGVCSARRPCGACAPRLAAHGNPAGATSAPPRPPSGPPHPSFHRTGSPGPLSSDTSPPPGHAASRSSCRHCGRAAAAPRVEPVGRTCVPCHGTWGPQACVRIAHTPADARTKPRCFIWHSMDCCESAKFLRTYFLHLLLCNASFHRLPSCLRACAPLQMNASLTKGASARLRRDRSRLHTPPLPPYQHSLTRLWARSFTERAKTAK